ncbi:MAG: HD domain-containing protein [Bacteroidales bacterium]|nr:HD domain-containing protein [Bacteroidales bacterium]
MDFLRARDFILSKLKTELKPALFYHNIQHTFDVRDAVVRIAKMEKVNSHDLVLLETAAYFHDAGLIYQYKDHEDVSIEMAGKHLPKFGYSPQEIRIINRMIDRTRLPQGAKSLPEKILCDADLDYLGRDDYFMIAHMLKYEWKMMGYETKLRDWYKLQRKFLSEHQYFTGSARKLRQETKEQNLAQISELLENCD